MKRYPSLIKQKVNRLYIVMKLKLIWSIMKILIYQKK
jgi:hypothetical protein